METILLVCRFSLAAYERFWSRRKKKKCDCWTCKRSVCVCRPLQCWGLCVKFVMKELQNVWLVCCRTVVRSALWKGFRSEHDWGFLDCELGFGHTMRWAWITCWWWSPVNYSHQREREIPFLFVSLLQQFLWIYEMFTGLKLWRSYKNAIDMRMSVCHSLAAIISTCIVLCWPLLVGFGCHSVSVSGLLLWWCSDVSE